jgi:diacylglycerol kinase (ATP)
VKRALLIYNPAAGGKRGVDTRARRLATLLGEAGIDVVTVRTESPGHAETLAREAIDSVDAVFCCGGDGTLRECVAGLLGKPLPLGFLPGGTANVMARTLGLPNDPVRAAALLVHGASMSVDVAFCGERPLLMQASAGLDAATLDRTNLRRKRLLGKAEIGLSALTTWWSYEYPAFSVRWDDEHRIATFAAVCNIPFYGGRWRLAPAARWNDQLLDLVVFRGRTRRSTLGFARDLALGRHHRRSDVEIVQVHDVEIDGAEMVSLQIDGDSVAETLPVRIRLAQRSVRLLVPETARTGLSSV